MGFQGFFAGYDLAGALPAGESHEIIIIAKQGMFFVPADRALGDSLRRAVEELDYKVITIE